MDANARTYNAAIPGIVQAKAAAGKRVSFVDMYPLITTGDLVRRRSPERLRLREAGRGVGRRSWPTLRPAPPAASTPQLPVQHLGSRTTLRPRRRSPTTTAAEVGVKFRAEKDGLHHRRPLLQGPDNAGPHEARLWKAISDSSTLHQPSSTTMTGAARERDGDERDGSSGWQEVVFATPVPVQAHTLYFATYYAPFGRYAADAGYFRDREIVHSPLRLPSQGSVDGNGFIRSGSTRTAAARSAGRHELLGRRRVRSDRTRRADHRAPPRRCRAARSTSRGARCERDRLPGGAVTRRNQVEHVGERRQRCDLLQRHRPGRVDDLLLPRRGDQLRSANRRRRPWQARRRRRPLPRSRRHPPSLTATAVSSRRIDLAWSDVAGETGYRVERSADGGIWAAVATTAANVTSYSNTGLAASTTYSYRVVATNGAGDSPPSPVASATTSAAADTTAPTAPTGLKADSPEGQGESLVDRFHRHGWQRPGRLPGVAQHGRCLGRVHGNRHDLRLTVSYTDSSVTGNMDYWYRVTAVDGAGNQSQPSNTISSRPK